MKEYDKEPENYLFAFISFVMIILLIGYAKMGV